MGSCQALDNYAPFDATVIQPAETTMIIQVGSQPTQNQLTSNRIGKRGGEGRRGNNSMAMHQKRVVHNVQKAAEDYVKDHSGSTGTSEDPKEFVNQECERGTLSIC